MVQELLPFCKSVVCTCFLNLSILYARVFMIMSTYLLLNTSAGRTTNSSKLLIISIHKEYRMHHMKLHSLLVLFSHLR
jgi:hypothetical protein